MQLLRGVLFGVLLMVAALTSNAVADDMPTLTRIATNLQNPRGVAVLPDGRLLVAEAGTGYVSDDAADNTGTLSLFEDRNGDGDFDDDGERTPIVTHIPGYNILYQFSPGRDEIVGIGDVLLMDDGRVFYTLDDKFERLAIVKLDADYQMRGYLVERESTLNSLVYDPVTEMIYAAESSRNAVIAVHPDGKVNTVILFPTLASNQQAVPCGLTIDPTTGDLIVTLFSGNLWDYYGEILTFMPGESKVVRVHPVTGVMTDEITDLTTAVDVAVDDAGNLYVVEMTTQWPTTLLAYEFDVFDPDGVPDSGGYARFSGRLTLYPADGGAPVILADDLDAPTNITYHDGALYLSVGQGTPNRPIWTDQGRSRIVGELYKLTLP